MSILLEALRKSEQSQRPVEAPTIHGQQQAEAESDPLRKGPAVALLLLALALIAWLGWRQYQPPVGSYRPPVTLPAQKGATLTTPVTSLATTQPSANPGAAGVRASGKQRTPVENYQQASGNSGSSTARRQQAGESSSVSAGSPSTTPTAVDRRISNTARASRDTATARKAVRKSRERNKNPAPISYWELPDAIREDVKEMRFSVLVYAEKPADRFVFIDGQRLHQGDAYQPGLVVEEIQRNGVVFSYRMYKFLVER